MLEIILILTATALVLGSGLRGVYDSHRNFRMQAQEIASSCGLRVEEKSGFWSAGLGLRARAGRVQVRILGPARKDCAPRVVVVAPWTPSFAGIHIRPETDKPDSAREIEIGDEFFDSSFYVVGPMRLLFALLDAEARRLMIAANASNTLQIGDGELRAEVFFPQMTGILRLLLEIAGRFTQPLDIAQRLAENARRDPEAGVRLRNLLLLAREFPGEAATEALRAACSDASPRVRLRAAQELGAEARGILLKLAESTEEDTVAAEAVSSLRRELPLERARAILVQALRRRRLRTAGACLERLGDSAYAEDVGTLAKVLALEKGDLAAAAAQALGATGSPAAEPPLLSALRHERTDACVAAVKSLGRIGTAAAVLPLKEAAEQTRDQELRGAARQAVAEIHSRLQGASPGQLSLARAEAGKLSLAAAEAGELSLVDPADDAGGRLSLPEEAKSPPLARG
jgi:HEAT repeat protein